MVLPTRRLFALLLIVALFTMSVREVTDPDVWWHLRTGQFILETRTIPHSDIFSSTVTGSEWVTHEWLSEVIIYAVYSWFGIFGLMIFFSALVTCIFWVAFLTSPGRPYIAGFAVLLGALATAPVWGVRPQIFTLLLTSITLLILRRYIRDNHRRSLYLLVPLMLIWVNLHSGFALGLVLIAVAALGLVIDEILNGESRSRVGNRILPLVLVLSACFLAVLINPNGARMYTYPFQTLSSRAMQAYIQKWFSPDFHLIEWQPFAAVLLATFSAMALSRQRVRFGDVLMLLVLGYAGLRSARNVPIFALAAIPLLAEHTLGFLQRQSWGQRLTPPQPRTSMLSGVTNAGLLLVILILSGIRVGSVIGNQENATAKAFPVAAVEYVKANHPPLPIYNSYTWGGYLIWTLYPDYPVFVDGRADVYGDAFLEYYLLAYRGGENWQKPLNEHSIRTVIIESGSPLAQRLIVSGEWRQVYQDHQAVIFVR